LQETLNCSRGKGVKVMNELTKVNLVTRVRQGLGKPVKIYVKNFD